MELTTDQMIELRILLRGGVQEYEAMASNDNTSEWLNSALAVRRELLDLIGWEKIVKVGTYTELNEVNA